MDRIIDTYRKRVTIEKYSYVAPLREVAENDYNLNIPRYVDTFEAEDSIDLDQVAIQLQDLEAEIKQTDEVIAGYCRELGISNPF